MSSARCQSPSRYRSAGRQLTPEQVIGLFENRLAAYKHPRDVMFLEVLPRNATDKVDRKRLSDMVSTAVALPTTS